MSIKNKSFRVLAYIIYFLNIIFRDLCGLFKTSTDERKLVHLDIEPTNICNANCVFCAYQYQEGNRYKTIDFEFVEKLLNSFCAAGGGDIGLTPIVGDPLVSKDLEKLVSCCRTRKEINRIGITTNGILLTVERFLSLKKAGITDIIISMTYPEENEYEKVYRSTSFKNLIHNLNELMNSDTKGINISLAIRTPRFFWKSHPLFKKAEKSGWNLSRNFYFDDWSGKVSKGLKENELLRRPLRGRHLPCTMLQSGPHALASGQITACGCRDLEAKSELADERLFHSFYESGDLGTVYNKTFNSLRERFLNHNPPQICKSCRHYYPEFRFTKFKDKLAQLLCDIKAACLFQ